MALQPKKRDFNFIEQVRRDGRCHLKITGPSHPSSPLPVPSLPPVLFDALLFETRAFFREGGGRNKRSQRCSANISTLPISQ